MDTPNPSGNCLAPSEYRALQISPGSVSYVGQSMSNVIRYKADIRPVTETLMLTATRGNDENVFFLQLESVNSLAAFGHAVIDGKRYDGHAEGLLLGLRRMRVLPKSIRLYQATAAPPCTAFRTGRGQQESFLV